ncbi:hypothetical protein [Roseibium algae]|uniref:Uncharacterized protein n=1 Tax=Roseibium algae TaxID=3123038 RepID=A0ABU8TSL6_9HYPH
MNEPLKSVPSAYRGLWERTLLERYSKGTLTSDRPVRVFWMQTALWHADLRIPLDRPDFSGIQNIEDCSRDQLVFIAGQEAFFGITKVDGVVCTWLRLMDLNPGTALDIGRMTFTNPDLLLERGIAEDYLEHWSRCPQSTPDAEQNLQKDVSGRLFLTSGNWSIRVNPRLPANTDIDPYEALDQLSHADLLWRASLEVTLCEKRKESWMALISTHPWIEGQVLQEASGIARTNGTDTLNGMAM